MRCWWIIDVLGFGGEHVGIKNSLYVFSEKNYLPFTMPSSPISFSQHGLMQTPHSVGTAGLPALLSFTSKTEARLVQLINATNLSKTLKEAFGYFTKN